MSLVGSVGQGWTLRCDSGGGSRIARSGGCVSLLRIVKAGGPAVVAVGEVDVAGAELWAMAKRRKWKQAGDGVHVCQACGEANRF
jgi:hypothetical protein